MKKIIDLLNISAEIKYKKFCFSLIPNIEEDSIIGVRIPNIRKIVKELDVFEKKFFLNELPHEYLEENILHSILISGIKDIDECIYELDRFLKYVDNWSVCDTLTCKILCCDLNKTFKYLKKCLKSKYTYQVRFAFVIMLKYFINDEYVNKCNKLACEYKSDEYYINMAIAWYFSYALIFQYDKTIKLFEDKKLDIWIHNKSIQKAIESFRISDDKKSYLKGLKIK